MKVTVQCFLFKYVKKHISPSIVALWHWQKKDRTIKSHVNVFIFRHGHMCMSIHIYKKTKQFKQHFIAIPTGTLVPKDRIIAQP